MLKEIISRFELLCERIRLVDPLMLFPLHRAEKLKWEKGNIKADIKKLRKEKQRLRRKNNGRKNEFVSIRPNNERSNR